jgi:hypothetical protein
VGNLCKNFGGILAPSFVVKFIENVLAVNIQATMVAAGHINFQKKNCASSMIVVIAISGSNGGTPLKPQFFCFMFSIFLFFHQYCLLSMVGC